MADKWPLANGIWSDAANWNDGTLPVNGDTIYLDGKTITIDFSVNLPSSIIRSDARSGGTVGGISTLSNTLTATIGEWRAGSHNPFRFGNGTTVNGDIYGGPTVPGRAIEYLGSGLTINGNCYGGTGVASGSNNSTAAYASGGTITINGDCYGGVLGPGAMVTNGGVITINGNCYGGSNANASGARLDSGSTITINGNCYGSNAANGARNESNGTLICNGEAVASDAGIPGVTGSLITGVTTVASVRSGSSGVFGATGFFKFKDANSQIYHFRADGVSQQFADVATVGEPPSTSNVRNGVSYHYGSLTGTLRVPDPQYVNAGVLTDDTVGTLMPSLDAAALRDAIGLASANLDTQFGAIRTAADDVIAETALVGAINGAVSVLPAVGISADRSPGVTLNAFVGETITQSITIYQTDGSTPFVLTGKTIVVVFETRQGTDVATVTSGSITIGGDDDNVVTFAYPSAATSTQRVLKFAIRDASAPKTVYLQGLLNIQRAPQVD
jgi:hypothetical protein